MPEAPGPIAVTLRRATGRACAHSSQPPSLAGSSARFCCWSHLKIFSQASFPGCCSSLATLAFAAGPALLRGLLASGRHLPDAISLTLLLLVSIYGGYFNGGLGILLLAAFGLIGISDLHQMNGLKTLASLVLSAVSVVTYSLAGLIDWSALVVTGLGCAAGGYVGAHMARKVQDLSLLRTFIVTVGLVTTIVFFAQAYG
ncbi:sulfite exporter TauE/SafE family protein [Salipiger sp. PrR003]|uniref:sulfite exporter TauE/SafE family protein n=1 Tax=Salipiger sp. PrR003 TaxID=2706776 RepID=UPI00351A2BC8